jgi:hypothetical protein
MLKYHDRTFRRVLKRFSFYVLDGHRDYRKFDKKIMKKQILDRELKELNR